MKIDIASVVAYIVSLIVQAVSIAFLIIMAVVVARQFGLNAPMIRPIAPIELAYTAGAWWLIRKAG